MHALVWTAPFEAVLREEPDPTPKNGEVLATVKAAGVCGSDLHGYRGHSPQRVPPLILGHEVVVQTGRDELFIVNPLVGCGECRLCASRQPNLCPCRGLLGLDRHGAFAELVAVPPANLLRLPDGMSPVLGTLVEPLATPMNALRGCDVEGAAVAVLGCGPIGLLAAYAARALGATYVACLDVAVERLEYARAHADLATADGDELAAAVADQTAGLGADVVIDAVGVEATWNPAIALARPGGAVALIGLGQAEGGMPVGDVVRRGIALRGVYAYTPDDFRRALELLSTSPPPLPWVQTLELADGAAMLDALAQGSGPVKAIFTF